MRFWKIHGIVACLAVLGSLAAGVRPVQAIEAFYTALEAKYVKPESQKESDVLLAIAFDQARCTICHPGDDKHRLTPYGGHLAWRINKFDKGNRKKIQEALEQVEKLRSDPGNPKSPTYGDLFRQGRLPPSPAR